MPYYSQMDNIIVEDMSDLSLTLSLLDPFYYKIDWSIVWKKVYILPITFPPLY